MVRVFAFGESQDVDGQLSPSARTLVESYQMSKAHTQMSYLIPAPEDNSVRLLRDAPANEQALVRLERVGPSGLSIGELLLLFLDSRSDPLLPLRILNRWNTLSELAHANPVDLLSTEGMSRLRLARLRAALELGRRMLTEPLQDRPQVRSPEDAAKLLIPEMAGLEQEQMRVLLMNSKNQVVGMSLVYQGSVDTTVIRMSELFRDAVRLNCPSIIVAHSHPSGDPSPSPSDVSTTTEIVKSGKLLHITVIDHLVIGNGGRWVSLKELGLGF
jgi:DNA repair protein RadC